MEDPRIEEDVDSESEEPGPFETSLGLIMHSNSILNEFYAAKKELEADRRRLLARFEVWCFTLLGEL